jgi:hypothetical protein
MKRPTLFRSLTGLEVKECDTIYQKINTNHKDYEKQRLKRENRKTNQAQDTPSSYPAKTDS